MTIEIRHKRTVQCMDRESEPGLMGLGSLQTHYREVHAVFEELIHRPWGTARWLPAADVWETDDAFVIELDTPGVEPETVKVTVEGRTLSIAGERKVAHTDTDHLAHCCERPEGRFARVFCFDEPVDQEQIEHRLKRGVLVVTIHKSSNQRKEQDPNEAQP